MLAFIFIFHITCYAYNRLDNAQYDVCWLAAKSKKRSRSTMEKTNKVWLFHKNTPWNWWWLLWHCNHKWTIFNMFDLSGDSKTPIMYLLWVKIQKNFVVDRVTYGSPIECKDLRVVFNLEPSVMYVSVTGTKSDPIIIN